MRIHRIALTNYRGVGHAEVAFATTGVTVIEGPNEVGKSSIAEAMGLLIRYLDSSKHADVLAVQPVDVDAGAQVEAEFTTGPYHVVYGKRWHRSPTTTLRITAPAPENLTGRDAHDRMTAILDETLDRQLWDALRFEQGTGITQAVLSNSGSLRRALDASAGGDTVTDDDTLWTRVVAERARYLTPKGQLPKSRSELAGQVTAAREALERATAAVAEVDQDTARLRRLEADAEATRVRLPDVRAAAEATGERRRGVEAEQRRVEGLDRVAELAGRDLADAERAHADRTRLIETVRSATRTLDVEQAAAGETETSLAAAERHRDEARRALDAATAALRAAESAERLAGADVAHFHAVAEVGALRERAERAATAERLLVSATEIIDTNPVDADLLTQLEGADREVDTLRARLNAGSPPVLLEALADVEVAVNGRRLALTPGATPVTVEGTGEQTVVEVGGLARVTIAPGKAARTARGKLDAAQSRLAGLYEAAGVCGDGALADAQARGREHDRAVEDVQRAREDLATILGEDTRAVLDDRITRLADSVAQHADHAAGRGDGAPPMPRDLEDARARAQAAASAAEQARTAVETAQAALEGPERTWQRAHERAFTHRANAERARADADRARGELDAARATASDDELDGRVGAARTAAGTARSEHEAGLAALADTNPEAARMEADNAADVLRDTEKRIHDADIEIAGLTGSLRGRGEEGRHDAVGRAQRLLAQLEREKRRTDRLAASAALLHDTLNRHREGAQRGYVGPFRDQIERLGRPVFGPDFTVAIDPADLTITDRTLNGITIGYSSLSTGAREQLCVIARLACAALVNPIPGEAGEAAVGGRAGDGARSGAGDDAGDAGAPVVIDDAFAYSDAQRLARFGSVLREAGRSSQVIVLTCHPDRYLNVGGVRTVTLDRSTVRRAPAATELTPQQDSRRGAAGEPDPTAAVHGRA